VEPLRILMVSARYFPFVGGIESHVHEVGRRMAERGHAVTVLTADPSGELPDTETAEGMRIIRVGAWLTGTDYCLAPGLATQLLKGDWDIVHVQGYHTFSAPLAMLASLFKRVPFVVTFHSGGHSSGFRNSIRALQHACLRPLMSYADCLIGVSQFEADFFSRRMRISRDRFVVVPNGASLPRPTSRRRPDPQRPLIVSLGRLERYKGHHRVIEAFVELRKTQPEARLRILGEGPYKAELIALVQRLGLDAHVVVGGIAAKERGAMANLLAGASLVVLMSDYEAHPVAVMEALSLNVPVLTSDTSGFRELAERGLVHAIPIASGSGDIAQAMSRALASKRVVSALSLPSWEECTDRLLSIYRSVARPSHSVDPLHETRTATVTSDRAIE
jgi:glycogen synthase